MGTPKILIDTAFSATAVLIWSGVLMVLALKLDAIRRAGRLATIEERIRLAFIDGAEAESRRTHRRGLTADELEAVLARFPG